MAVYVPVCALTIDVVHGESVGEVGQVGLFSERSFLDLLWSPIVQTLEKEKLHRKFHSVIYKEFCNLM